MMEMSLSFLAWLCVLLIQVLVHIKVVYLRKGRDEDEPLLVEADSSAPSSALTESPVFAKKFKRQSLTRSNSDPALDGDDSEDYYDDQPPNLEHRLSQTGSEMMSSCKSLESFVQEQILSQ